MKGDRKRKLLILGINGSPDKSGNTYHLLNTGLRVCADLGAETELLNCREALKGMSNQFCVNCQSPCQAKCAEGKPLSRALELLSRADGIIMGSPVYFGSVSGQLKAFWDKTRSLRYAKRLLNVVGGAVSVGASQYGGQESTVRVLQDMMMVHGMIIVGDGYVDDDCGHMGAMAKRPALEDIQANERVKILARRVFEVAEATRAIRIGRS